MGVAGSLGVMCGIVAVLGRPAQRSAPRPDEVVGLLDDAVAAARPGTVAAAIVATDATERADRLLRGAPGLLALAGHPELATALTARLDLLTATADTMERALESDGFAGEIEEANAALVRLRDAVWAISRDRLHTEIGRAHV